VQLILPDANENRITQCRQVHLVPGQAPARTVATTASTATVATTRSTAPGACRACAAGSRWARRAPRDTVRIGLPLSVRVATPYTSTT
jgi:hypothetical protein